MKRWFRFLIVAATVQMLAAATLAVVHSPAVAWDRKYEDNPGAPAEGDPDEPGGPSLRIVSYERYVVSLLSQVGAYSHALAGSLKEKLNSIPAFKWSGKVGR